MSSKSIENHDNNDNDDNDTMDDWNDNDDDDNLSRDLLAPTPPRRQRQNMNGKQITTDSEWLWSHRNRNKAYEKHCDMPSSLQKDNPSPTNTERNLLQQGTSIKMGLTQDTATTITSPATQTLNNLSQQPLDLFFDMSQLESQVAALEQQQQQQQQQQHQQQQRKDEDATTEYTGGCCEEIQESKQLQDVLPKSLSMSNTTLNHIIDNNHCQANVKPSLPQSPPRLPNSPNRKIQKRTIITQHQSSNNQSVKLTWIKSLPWHQVQVSLWDDDDDDMVRTDEGDHLVDLYTLTLKAGSAGCKLGAKLRAYQTQNHTNSTMISYAKVIQVIQGSLLDKAGVQVRDVLCYAVYPVFMANASTTTHISFPPYRQIIAWMKQARSSTLSYPFDLGILRSSRRKQPEQPSFGATVTTASANDVDKPTLASLPIIPVTTMESIGMSQPTSSTDYNLPVPFCTACHSHDVKSHHHQMCPLHKDFLGSLHQQKLNKILTGIQCSCEACQKEYHTGKRALLKHNCPRQKRRPIRNTPEQVVTDKLPIVGVVVTDVEKSKDPNKSIPMNNKEASSSEQTNGGSHQTIKQGMVNDDTATGAKRSQPTLPTTSSPAEYIIVPFCDHCHGKDKAKTHHVMCPKHDDFSRSVMDERLQDIRRGIALGCEACQVEFQGGYVKRQYFKSQPHTELCQQQFLQQREFQQLQRKTSESKPSEKTNQPPSNSLPSSSSLRLPLQSSTQLLSGSIKMTEPRDHNLDIVPFCRQCNGLSNPVHHALCPKNPNFVKSGAEAKLQRIRHGVQLGCVACQDEFQHGKISNQDHNEKCQEYYETNIRLNQNRNFKKRKPTTVGTRQRKRTVALREGYAHDHDVSHRRRKWTTTVAHKMRCQKEADDSKESTDDSENNDMGSSQDSPFQPQSGRHRPLMGLKVTREDKKATTDAHGHVLLRGKRDTKQTVVASTKTVTNHAKRKVRPLNNRRNENEEFVVEETAFAAPHNNRIMTEQATLKPQWVSCQENPWGPGGHQDGDIVLFSSGKGLGHLETVLPSPRYVVNPFVGETNYHTTHRSQQDGFQLLLLQRDAMATRPWGFSLYRHDFGGACLVKDVAPLSPAAAAVYAATVCLNVNNDSGLRVDDMLIAINGKLVGGMTQVGVEVELEICGADLLLLVSRYKFDKHVTHRILAEETLALNSIDKRMHDDRYLGWHVLGGVSLTGNEHGVESTDSSLQRDDESIESGERRVENVLGEKKHDKHHQPALCSNLDLSASVKDQQAVPQAHLHASAQRAESQTNGLSDARWTVSPPMAKLKRGQGSIDEAISKNHDSPEAPCPNRQNNLEMDRKKTVRNRHSQTSSGVKSEETGDIIYKKGSKDESSNTETENRTRGDGELWMGCVCGQTHSKKQQDFWIQCDTCDTWYLVSSKCIGFSETHAKSVKKYCCWACADDGSNSRLPCGMHKENRSNRQGKCLKNNSNSPLQSRQSKIILIQQDVAERVSSSTSSRCSESSGSTSTPSEVYEPGSLVMVKARSWPGVNSQGGVAKVLDSGTNENGKLLYSVKYIVGRKEKGIKAKYLCRHTFDYPCKGHYLS